MTLPPQRRPPADPSTGVSQAHRKPSRLRALVGRVRIEDAREATLLTGLALIALAFIVAQILGSIVWAPLSLLVPGAVLTLAAITARPETPQ